MKKLLLGLLFFLSTCYVNAQVQSPIKWSFTSKNINANTFEVHLTATISPGWHTYSQTTPDGGPVRTSISVTKNPLLTLQGAAKEIGKMEQHHEALFGVDVKQFSGKVDFVQTITVRGNAKTSVSGTIEYMTCNDHECLPPFTQKFTVSLR